MVRVSLAGSAGPAPHAAAFFIKRPGSLRAQPLVSEMLNVRLLKEKQADDAAELARAKEEEEDRAVNAVFADLRAARRTRAGSRSEQSALDLLAFVRAERCAISSELLRKVATSLHKHGIHAKYGGTSAMSVLSRQRTRHQLGWRADKRSEAARAAAQLRQDATNVLGFSPPRPPNLPYLCAVGCGCEVDGASSGCWPCLCSMHNA